MRSVSRSLLLPVLAAMLLGSALYASASSPSGLDWFQLLTNQQTGADNTGDGGSGNPDDLNYYYVGQSFTTQVQIQSNGPGATAANIWVDYQSASDTASGLTTGSFFNTWSAQVVSSTVSPGVGRIYSTGFNIPVVQSSGTGTFGTVTWTINRPSAANYGTSTPRTLDINIGTVGDTTESNISLNGMDLLDSAEDFQFQAWADTVKPFAETNNIASGTANVAIDSNYLFRLFDTKKGEGFSTSTAFNAGGVGTGVNTATPPGSLVFTPSHFAATSYDSYSCSGVWGTNVCNVTIDPPSPLGIGSDSRNWQYSTSYSLCISGYQDLASPSQNQLGDANGPNTMNAKCFGFTTEADTVAPQVVSESPAASSAGNPVGTNITINVEDRKSYPAGPSGVGVATSTCAFDVWTTTQATTTYTIPSANVTVTPLSYGKQYIIDPTTNFPQNERVYVRTSGCQDLVGNTMTNDSWFFDTSDGSNPYVTNVAPSDDQSVSSTTNIQFSIVDTGSGVDLSNTIVYIDGVYYKTGGGAGTVTNVGTQISFTTSTNLTPFVSNTSTNQYNFNIGPLVFGSTDAIPVIIYSRDLSGNLMPVYIYGLTGSAASMCPAGSSFCGSNTSWNGSQCVGTGGGSGGSCSSSGGGGAATTPPNQINDATLYIIQIDQHSVLLSWNSNQDGTARVVYGTEPSANLTLRPDYGYQLSTPETADNSVHHSVVVGGLNPGQLYYFRAITKVNGVEAISSELRMAPLFTTTIVNSQGTPLPQQPVCPIVPVPTNPVTPPTRPSRSGPVPVIPTKSPAPASAPVSPGSPIVTQPPIAQEQPPVVEAPAASPVIIDRTIFRSPAIVGAGITIFLLLMGLLSANMIRLGMIADKLANIGPGKKRRHGGHAIALAVLMVGLGLSTGTVMNFGTGALPAAFKSILPQNEAEIRLNVSGAITDVSGRPVAGLMITAGDTSILTNQSGAFAFNDISKQQGLQIYSSLLKKPVNKEIGTTSPMDFIFDPSLMASLEEVIDLESKGDLRTLYKQDFADALKQVVSSDDFAGRYPKQLDASFKTADTIYVGTIQKRATYVSKLDQRTIPQVINIEVFTMQGVANFVFAEEQGKWKLVF